MLRATWSPSGSSRMSFRPPQCQRRRSRSFRCSSSTPPPHSPTGLEWNCTPRKLSAGRGRQLPLSRLETEGGGGGAAAGPATRHHASPPSPRTAARCDSPLGASLAPIPPPPTRNTCLFPASGEAAASLAQVSKTEGASEFGEAPPPPLKRAGLDGGLLGRGGGVLNLKITRLESVW